MDTPTNTATRIQRGWQKRAPGWGLTIQADPIFAKPVPSEVRSLANALSARLLISAGAAAILASQILSN